MAKTCRGVGDGLPARPSGAAGPSTVARPHSANSVQRSKTASGSAGNRPPLAPSTSITLSPSTRHIRPARVVVFILRVLPAASRPVNTPESRQVKYISRFTREHATGYDLRHD